MVNGRRKGFADPRKPNLAPVAICHLCFRAKQFWSHGRTSSEPLKGMTFLLATGARWMKMKGGLRTRTGMTRRKRPATHRSDTL